MSNGVRGVPSCNLFLFFITDIIVLSEVKESNTEDLQLYVKGNTECLIVQILLLLYIISILKWNCLEK